MEPGSLLHRNRQGPSQPGKNTENPEAQGLTL
jgi:hypothetical protein